MKNVGNELRTIMRNKKLKQTEIAKKLNMTPVNLSKILKKESIDAALLEKIAKVIDTPVSFFFRESTNEVTKEVKETVEDPKSTYNCQNCERLEKIIDYQNRHIERLENELEQYRQKTVL
jgi:transcriptional regulator with XRE-family HTH domain